VCVLKFAYADRTVLSYEIQDADREEEIFLVSENFDESSGGEEDKEKNQQVGEKEFMSKIKKSRKYGKGIFLFLYVSHKIL
jgi:hypothetical protein